MLIQPVSSKKFTNVFGRKISEAEAYENNYFLVNEKAGVVVNRETGETEFIGFSKIEATEAETMKLLSVISPKAPDPIFVSEKLEFGIDYETRELEKKLKVSKAKRLVFSLLPMWLFLFIAGMIVLIRG